jgi:hypothetical protein
VDPDEIVTQTPDAAWTGVLRVVAAACAASALLMIIGAAVSTLADDTGGQVLGSSFERRLLYFARVANPSLAIVVLVGAVAVAVGLRDRPGTTAEQVIRWATFIACALVVLIAAVGAFEDARNQTGLGGAQRVWTYSGWLATAVLALAGAAITDALPRRLGER